MKIQGMLKVFLILLGVLMIVGIAVIVLSLLGILGVIGLFTMGVEEPSPETQSLAYWQSASPLAIKGIQVRGTSVSMTVQSTSPQQVTLTKILFDENNLGVSSTVFQPGEVKTITGIVEKPCEFSGTVYSYQVTIEYEKEGLAYKFNGTHDLIGSCS